MDSSPALFSSVYTLETSLQNEVKQVTWRYCTRTLINNLQIDIISHPPTPPRLQFHQCKARSCSQDLCHIPLKNDLISTPTATIAGVEMEEGKVPEKKKKRERECRNWLAKGVGEKRKGGARQRGTHQETVQRGRE